ncbi:MAG: PEP-CTERM sorting domain-containing protein [candidate division Zixibacteria bacterium]|nr:PEP-CTERM sorting domain-containing protein [candidate division Zixibacteria bacterium]
MKKSLMKKYFIIAAFLFWTTAVNAAPVQTILVSGQIVSDHSFGTLVHHVGRNFTYEATYELDISKAINTWINGGGWTVYEIDDGGVTYNNTALIFDGTDISSGDRYSSNIVGFEFNDNLVENWSSDSSLSFLNLGLADATPVDAIVLGFYDPLISDNTEVWVTLLFEADLFDGYEESGLPQSINLDKYIGGGGEFAQWDDDVKDWVGWAQFRVDTVDVSTVPVPGSLWLLCSALMGFAGLKRRKV